MTQYQYDELCRIYDDSTYDDKAEDVKFQELQDELKKFIANNEPVEID